MSQNILVIGDQHFQEKNLEESKILVTKVLELCTANAYDFVVLLGDMEHSHEILKLFPHNLATRFLKSISKILPTFALIGNHEKVHNAVFQTDDHPYTALDDYPNLHIIAKARYVNFKGKNYFFVPYVPNGRFHEALLTTSKDEAELQERFKTTTAIFGHQEFRGCQTGAIKSTKGDIWPLNYPLVISGHIHSFCVLQSNMIYPGTPNQVTFDDSCDKTVSNFVFSDGEFKHSRIDLNLPKKKIITITASEIDDFKVEPNCQIKLKIIGTSAEIKAVMKNHKIKVLETEGVMIAYKTTSEKKNTFSITEKKDYTYITRLQDVIAGIPRLTELFKEFI